MGPKWQKSKISIQKHSCLSLQVNQLLQIAKLDGSADDSIRPANNVNYVYNFGPLVDTGAGAAAGSLSGATIPMTTVDMLLTGLHTITFSLSDFNTLRQLTGEALQTLDKKVDEILNVQQLSCSLGLWCFLFVSHQAFLVITSE